MDLKEYQEKAMTTCMPSCENIPYMLFNLQGEVGELSSKIAKLIRKRMLRFMSVEYETDGKENVADFMFYDTKEEHEVKDAIAAECGDVLWQLSGICSVLGFSLEDVARQNLSKLASRKARGVIEGNGDNR